MLTTLAHIGRPVEPHDLSAAWNLDPLIIVSLLTVAAVYARGRPDPRWRAAVDRRRWILLLVALSVIAVALVSPLDALSGALASAHMVQHVLLVLVAAPLLAVSAAGTTLYRGLPPGVRRAGTRARRRLRVSRLRLHHVARPGVAWLAAAGALWVWHSAVLYDAALNSEVVHAAEHASFLATSLLFWWVVLRSRAAVSAGAGLGVVLVFGMGLQSALLAMLLTFAQGPWYTAYANTTAAWGLDPLADQQLAGAIMWVPSGAVYVAAGLSLFVRWLRSIDQPADATQIPDSVGGASR